MVPERAGRRRLAVLHPALSTRYTALVAAVAGDVEAALSPSVVSNRVALASVDPPSLRLAPWRAERAAFEGRLVALAADAGGLVFADVRACYPSIRPAVVEAALRRLGSCRGLAADVRRFLEALPSVGVRGLPVGPDPSAVLANAVLARVDEALADAGARHVRWVDDIVVSVGDRERAERTLDALRGALAGLGLELNERKTHVIVDAVALARRPTVSPTGRPARVG